MRRVALALLVLLAAAPALPAAEIIRVSTPPVHLGTWLPELGRFDPAPAAQDASLIFDNQTSSSGALFAGSSRIVMDWGLLESAPENEIFAATFGYATLTIGTVDLTLRLHAAASGFGDPGVYVEIPLTGLPGSTDGSPASFTFEAFFDTAILPDGPIGWSYQCFDETTGPMMATGDLEPGIVDAVDLYDPGFVYLASTDAGPVFASLLVGIVGSFPGVLSWDTISAGTLWLHGAGTLAGGTASLLEATGLPAASTSWFVLGAVRIDAPFKGGVLVPLPQVLLPLPTGAGGALQLPLIVEDPLPSGAELFAQVWVLDPGSTSGWSATNGVTVVTP